MNRFSASGKTIFLSKAVKFLPLIIGIIVVAVFLAGVNYVSTSSLEGQQESLEKALSRDVAQCYANPARAKEELGWEARYDLERMCRDSWRFICRENGKTEQN